MDVEANDLTEPLCKDRAAKVNVRRALDSERIDRVIGCADETRLCNDHDRRSGR